MRIFAFLILWTLAGVACVLAQQPITWTLKSVKPELASMRAVDMRTDDIGIAVGEAGVVWRYYGNSDVQPFPVLDFNTTSVTGMREMYGVAYNTAGTAVAVGDSGQVWRSTDDGETWSLQTTIVTKQLTAIAGDDQTFVAVGVGCISASTDDGLSWNTIPYDGINSDVAGSTEDGWMVVGERVSFSADLVNWVDVTPESDVHFKKVDFVKSTDGNGSAKFGVAGDPFFMATTNNRGKSWIKATLPSNLSAKYPRAETKCFEWKDNLGPAIWMLEDRYTPEEITLLAADSKLEFVQQPTGEQIVTFIYDAIAFISMDRIVGVGPGGQSHTVLYDNSIPRLWFSSNVDASLFLKSVSVSDSTHLVVGSQSNVLVALSTNNGLTYNTIHEGALGSIGVDCCIANDGAFLVMYDSMFVDYTVFPPANKQAACVMRSVDSGKTWVRTFAHSNRLRSQGVSITPSGTIVARTYGNTWYVSRDHGMTWDSTTLGSSDLYFLPPSSINSDSLWTTTAYNSTTQSYELYVTLNGTTWVQRTPVAYATDYKFLSPDVGYASCRVMHPSAPSDDEIYSTSDGGATWNLIYHSTGALGLSCIALDTTNNIVIAMGVNGHTVVVPMSQPAGAFVDSSLTLQAQYASPNQVLVLEPGRYLAVGPYHSLFRGSLDALVTHVPQSATAEHVFVYPIPASNTITVIGDKKVATVHLYAIDGTEHAVTPANRSIGEVTIPLATVSPGFYTLLVRYETGHPSLHHIVVSR